MAEAAAFEDLWEHGQFSATRPAKPIPSSMIQPQAVTVIMTAMVRCFKLKFACHDDCRLATVFSWWILDFIPGGNFCRGVLLSAAALGATPCFTVREVGLGLLEIHSFYMFFFAQSFNMHPLFFALTPSSSSPPLFFCLITFRFSLLAGVFKCSCFVVGFFFCCAVVWLLLCLCRCCCVFFCSFHVC